MKSVFKSTAAVTVLICMIFAAAVPCVSTDDGMMYPTDLLSDSMSIVDLDAEIDLVALRNYITPHFAKLEDTIDISEFRIPVSLKDPLSNFFWRDVPEAFHVYGLGYSSVGSYLTKVRVSYNYTQEEYDERISPLKASAASIVNDLVGNDSLDDVQKALIVHDRLCEICEYDYNYTKDGKNAYGALVNRTAVCDGYARAYEYLLNLCGVKCYTCISESMVHGWNLVQIDGVFYHVDVTWDDISWASGKPGVLGAMEHTNFLRSNEGIYATGHRASDYYTPVNDDRFDNAFWQNSETQFCYINGEIYWFDNENAQLKTYDGRVLSTASDKWYASATSYYTGNFVRMCAKGDSIFYTTSNKLYEYDTYWGTVNEWGVGFDRQKDGEAFYGIGYNDYVLTIEINTIPYGSTDDLRHITINFPREPSWIRADISSSTGIASTQTVYATIETNGDILGYFWGPSEYYYENEFYETPFANIEIPVDTQGTYYFNAATTDGAVTTSKPITFCRIKLNAKGGTVPCDNILISSTDTIVLPTPEKSGENFNGWTTLDGAESGQMTVTVNNPPLYSEYYATWKKTTRTVAGRVTTVGNVEATVTVIHADGTVTTTAATGGRYSFETAVGKGATVKISAPGHVSLLYNIGSGVTYLPDSEMFLAGDIDLDGSVTNMDVIALFKFVSSGRGAASPVVDVDNDGDVTNMDVVMLFRYVSGSVKTLPESVYKIGR
ncbi:MAG: hypothetical protein J6330_10495 [Clostridia bacterium]|nr:hypothetical protein [Clostridia bacterium]